MVLSSLTKRILSALILAPFTIIMIFFGGWIMAAGLTVIFAITVYEWYRLTQKVDQPIPAFFTGLFYILIAICSFITIREAYSLNLLVVFLCMVWCSDIGAYFVGKNIGGPKLAAKISPNKTWSGFAGAIFCPAIFSMIWLAFFGLDTRFEALPSFLIYPMTFITGMIIGAIGQAGDLLISFVKRIANVKDTGNIIPGHGGILDRIDSLLLATPIFLVIITLLDNLAYFTNL